MQAYNAIAAFLSLFVSAGRQWWNDNTLRLAASLAFYTVFSFAPIVIITLAIASTVVGRETAAQQMIQQIDGLVGPQGAATIEMILANTGQFGSNKLAALVGVMTLIIGSTAVFAELQGALNQIWDVKPRSRGVGVIRKLIRDRLLSFALVVATGFLLLVTLIISAILSGAQEFLNILIPGMPWLWWSLNILISFCVTTLMFMAIYKILPDVTIDWRDVAIGAVVTTVLFSIGKFAIGQYLGQWSTASAYGAAGSFVVLLVWVYYSALICFFGAEFTQVYARRYGSQIRPSRQAVRIGRQRHGDTTPQQS